MFVATTPTVFADGIRGSITRPTSRVITLAIPEEVVDPVTNERAVVLPNNQRLAEVRPGLARLENLDDDRVMFVRVSGLGDPAAASASLRVELLNDPADVYPVTTSEVRMSFSPKLDEDGNVLDVGVTYEVNDTRGLKAVGTMDISSGTVTVGKVSRTHPLQLLSVLQPQEGPQVAELYIPAGSGGLIGGAVFIMAFLVAGWWESFDTYNCDGW